MTTAIDVTKYPSVVQRQRHLGKTSEKYRFIPTTRALSVFADYGWQPVSVREAGTIDPENRPFVEHMIKLENSRLEKQLMVSGAKPQITLLNAHNARRSYRLYAGLIELVCLNGLLADGTFAEQYGVRHVGHADSKVADAIAGVSSYFGPVFEARERWQKLMLSRDEQLAFADAASHMRFGDEPPFDAVKLLTLRHLGQSEPTLWNTYQKVQENIMQGGLDYRKRNGHRGRTRAIRSVSEDTRINLALWRLARSMEVHLQ